MKVKSKKFPTKTGSRQGREKVKSLLQMVDISQKQATEREAVASCIVNMKKETLKLIKNRRIPKGDVLLTAKLAGILAAKKTHEIIPLCHPLLIDNADISFEINQKKSTIKVSGTVKSTGKTGVEMEALLAVSVSALTIYDMCKPVDKNIVISDIKLLKKTGGKSGTYVRR